MLYYNYPISLKNSFTFETILDNFNIFNFSSSHATENWSSFEQIVEDSNEKISGDEPNENIEKEQKKEKNRIYYYWEKNERIDSIKINLESSQNVLNPNLIYSNFAKNERNIKCKINNLHVVKKTHFFQVPFDYQGELILENSPITNDSGKKVYLVILLQESAATAAKPPDMMLENIYNINDLIEILKNKTNNTVWWFGNFNLSSEYEIFLFPAPYYVKTGFFNKFNDNIENIQNPFFMKTDYKNHETVQIGRIAGAFSEGDEPIFRNEMEENAKSENENVEQSSIFSPFRSQEKQGMQNKGINEDVFRNEKVVEGLAPGQQLKCRPVAIVGKPENTVVVPLVGSGRDPVANFLIFAAYSYFIISVLVCIYVAFSVLYLHTEFPKTIFWSSVFFNLFVLFISIGVYSFSANTDAHKGEDIVKMRGRVAGTFISMSVSLLCFNIVLGIVSYFYSSAPLPTKT